MRAIASAVRTDDRVRVAFARVVGRSIVCDYEAEVVAVECEDWKRMAVDHALEEWRQEAAALADLYEVAEITSEPIGKSSARRLRMFAMATLFCLLILLAGIAHVATTPSDATNEREEDRIARWFVELPDHAKLEWLRSPAMGHHSVRAIAFEWLLQRRIEDGGHPDGLMKAVETATMQRGGYARADKVAARSYIRTFPLDEAAEHVRCQAVAAGADPDVVESHLRSMIHE